MVRACISIALPLIVSHAILSSAANLIFLTVSLSHFGCILGNAAKKGTPLIAALACPVRIVGSSRKKVLSKDEVGIIETACLNLYVLAAICLTIASIVSASSPLDPCSNVYAIL